MNLTFREVTDEDIEIFYGFHQDREQQWQAAFVSKDPSDLQAHREHWNKILNNPEIANRTILLDEIVVGYIGRWPMDGVPQLTYWVGKEYCGRGIASQAVGMFIATNATRPIEGRCAFDNHASAKVLLNNGFVQVGEDRYFSNARNEEIGELIFRLT